MSIRGGEIGDGVTSDKKVEANVPEWYEEIEETDPDMFTYSNNSDGTKMITGFSTSYTGTPSDIKIPQKTKEGADITKINGYAFQGNNKITSLVIQGNIKTILNDAFRDEPNLERVALLEGVERMQAHVFYNDSAIKEVYLPSTLKSIDSGTTSYTAFNRCSNIEKITVPDFIVGTYGASAAFPNSKGKINEVKFSGEITKISNNSFSEFSSLPQIEIPNTVTLIGDHAFDGCSHLQSISIPENVTQIGEYAFYNNTSLGNVDFSKSNSLKIIESDAFRNCTSLVKVILPEGLEQIYAHVFMDDIAIKEVYLPSTLKRIDSGMNMHPAFDGCGNIEKITVPDFIVGTYGVSAAFPNSKGKINEVKFSGEITKISNDSFSGFSSLPQIEIPNTVTLIEDHAFDGCSYLQSISIPENVTQIGNYAFYNNVSLKNVDFTNCKRLTQIQNDAFRKCKALTTLKLPEGLTTLGNNSFFEDIGLQEIVLPSTITNLGDSSYPAFNGCYNVKKITCSGNIPAGSPWGANNAEVIKQ